MTGPSERAVKAAEERMRNFTPTKRWDAGGCEEKTEAVLAAAYPILRSDVVTEIAAALRARRFGSGMRTVDALAEEIEQEFGDA